MDEVHYLISDASRKVDVEAHVLRYWEEELELAIPRNEMGHRYYTDFHIRLFKQVKNLKEKGYQLKAIKHALEQIKKLYPFYEGRIYQVNIAPIVKKWGGALNCLSWTVSKL